MTTRAKQVPWLLLFVLADLGALLLHTAGLITLMTVLYAVIGMGLLVALIVCALMIVEP